MRFCLTRRRVLFVAAILALIVIATWLRVTRTAEYTVIFGSAKERADVCRSVPFLAAARQVWLLKRLLRDEDEEVRLAAVTAARTGVENREIDDILETMVLDATQPGEIRSKAGDVLLRHDPVRRKVLDFLNEKCTSREFRSACPFLAARWIERNLPTATEETLAALLAQAVDEFDPAHEFVQTVIRDNVGRFAPLRNIFVKELETKPPFRVQQFLVSCLQAIDGAARGYSAEDWRDETVAEAGEGRLVMQPIRLHPGKQRLFVKLYQADFADPTGGHAGRHTYNYCVFKLLLRRARHRPAGAILGLPRARLRPGGSPPSQGDH